MIATPLYDGKMCIEYFDSLMRTIRLCSKMGIEIIPIHVCYDALIQRARNDLFKIAHDSDVDSIFFIDADMIWDENDFMKIAIDGKDFSGAAVPKKSDISIDFNVALLPEGVIYEDKYLIVKSVGTGFIKLSRNAINKIWDYSDEYKNGGNTNRMVFNVGIVECELYSEDSYFCHNWRNAEGKIYIHTDVNITHIGNKYYRYELQSALNKISEAG